MSDSPLERSLMFLLKVHKIPTPEREYRFHLTRRWRFDLAWPEQKVAVEVQGGGFVHGAHSRGVGLRNDCEKYTIAQLQGWVVILVTDRHIENLDALAWVRKALELREGASV